MEEEWWNGGRKARRDDKGVRPAAAFDRRCSPSLALLGNDDPCLALFTFSGT